MAEIAAEYTEPNEEVQELEKKLELLTQARINLRVPPPVFDKLDRQATFHNISIEEHCTNILIDSLNQRIGAPHISGPSKLNDTIQPKIVGPSEVSSVTRA
jgi:hypothetical protein